MRAFLNFLSFEHLLNTHKLAKALGKKLSFQALKRVTLYESLAVTCCQIQHHKQRWILGHQLP